MSAVLKSQAVRPHRVAASPARGTSRRLTVLPTATPRSAPVSLPSAAARPQPLWLTALVVGQRVSLGLAAVVVTGTLSAYALTVDTNRRLTAATVTLGRLQEQQQQLTTANAVFKNHLAQAAEAIENDALHPKNVIFLEAADLEALPPLPAPASAATPTTDKRFFPKGY